MQLTGLGAGARGKAGSAEDAEGNAGPVSDISDQALGPDGILAEVQALWLDPALERETGVLTNECVGDASERLTSKQKGVGSTHPPTRHIASTHTCDISLAFLLACCSCCKADDERDGWSEETCSWNGCVHQDAEYVESVTTMPTT
jgi:hypothetical protein